MSKVYVINSKLTFNYTQAKQYGELVHLTEGLVNMNRPQNVLGNIRKHLADYKDGDWILISGNCLPVFLTPFQLLLRRNIVKDIRILVYDYKISGYHAYIINVKDEVLTIVEKLEHGSMVERFASVSEQV